MKIETIQEKYDSAFRSKRKAFRKLLELEKNGAESNLINAAERELYRLKAICRDLSKSRVNEAFLRTTA
jgi:hypothetical protein